jgi:four helix bundle protein
VDERYGITSQMRRAAVSVPSNIAEGHGRSTTGEYRHALSIARGSLKELETVCEIARKLGYLTLETYGELLDSCSEISRMLTGLKRAIRR